MGIPITEEGARLLLKKEYETELKWLYGKAIECGDIKTALEILKQGLELDVVLKGEGPLQVPDFSGLVPCSSDTTVFDPSIPYTLT